MKRRKEFENNKKPEPKPGSAKTVQQLTEQITHIVGKNPKKAALILESWVKEGQKSQKKAS